MTEARDTVTVGKSPCFTIQMLRSVPVMHRFPSIFLIRFPIILKCDIKPWTCSCKLSHFPIQGRECLSELDQENSLVSTGSSRLETRYGCQEVLFRVRYEHQIILYCLEASAKYHVLAYKCAHMQLYLFSCSGNLNYPSIVFQVVAPT